MKDFKYDVVTLIKCVRDRPCLWDKSLENYKDRVERRTAWEEIFNILDETYEEMTPEEKRITGHLILNKWTNVRDTFMKSLKNKLGRPKRKYVLYQHLKFLVKHTSENEYKEFIVDVTTPFYKLEDQVDYDVNDHVSDQPINEHDMDYREKSIKIDLTDDSAAHTSSNEDCTHKRRSKRNKRKSSRTSDSYINDLDFVEVDETSDPRVMNEDEAFFASLLPTIVKYNEDERLEFRIEVLALMKRIKNKKKWSDSDQ